MAYTTVGELRAEGVTDVPVRRLRRLIGEVTAEIDLLCGWFFEPRERTYVIPGRGTASIYLPAPLLRLDEVKIGETTQNLAQFRFAGGPFDTLANDLRLTLRSGRFPKKYIDIEMRGIFGMTSPSSGEFGDTPAPISRAAMLLISERLGHLAGDEAFQQRNRWRVLEERTRDQSYRLDKDGRRIPLMTGNPDVDVLLMNYRKPRPMGAA